jgi:hypothetical protein
VTAREDGPDDSVWLGEIAVRHGLGDRFEGGIRIARTAGLGEVVSVALVEPKFELTAPGAETAISATLGLGAAWGEMGYDWEEGVYAVSPAIFVGHRVSPTVELIVAPRFSYLQPDGAGDSLTTFGLALGARIGDRTSAVYPTFEIQIADEAGSSSDSETIYMFGVGVGVGN